MTAITHPRGHDVDALFVGYGLLTLLTAGYCWLAWLLTAVAMTLVHDPSPVTRLTAWSALPAPWQALFWQVLAAVSLIGALAWGTARARRMSVVHAHLWPIAAHALLLFACLVWQLVGALDSLVAVAYVLG